MHQPGKNAILKWRGFWKEKETVERSTSSDGLFRKQKTHTNLQKMWQNSFGGGT